MSTDAEIIDAVLNGDVDGYAELVTRYQLAAWKLAYGMVGNLEDAKELSQNGFVKAYRHLRQFRRRSAFSTWLYRIIANECKDFLKSRVRRPQAVAADPDPDDDEAVPFDVADAAKSPREVLADQELATHLGAAIQELSMKQREAFVLHHLQGMSLEDVSQVMECRVGTVKAHLFRACEHLRARVAPSVRWEG